MKYSYDRNFVWHTLDGRAIPVRCMTDVHLANVIHYIKGSLPASDRKRALLKMLRDEAKFRGLKQSFLDSAPIPWQDPDGKWLKYNGKKGEYEVIGR
jgi:hypothetical protein